MDSTPDKLGRLSGLRTGGNMKVTFSVDQHDSDGDVYDKCLLLHVDKNLIIRMERNELNDFINSLRLIQKELKINYDI